MAYVPSKPVYSSTPEIKNYPRYVSEQNNITTTYTKPNSLGRGRGYYNNQVGVYHPYTTASGGNLIHKGTGYVLPIDGGDAKHLPWSEQMTQEEFDKYVKNNKALDQKHLSNQQKVVGLNDPSRDSTVYKRTNYENISDRVGDSLGAIKDNANSEIRGGRQDMRYQRGNSLYRMPDSQVASGTAYGNTGTYYQPREQGYYVNEFAGTNREGAYNVPYYKVTEYTPSGNKIDRGTHAYTGGQVEGYGKPNTFQTQQEAQQFVNNAVEKNRQQRLNRTKNVLKNTYNTARNWIKNNFSL